LSEGLYSELLGTRVGVSVVIPGGIATDIKKNSDISHTVSKESSKSNMILTPKKAAELIIKAMEQKKLRTYIGKDCRIMSIFYKLSPILAMKMINKVMSANEH
jgi:short-subunit dehydrogenase